MPKQHRALGNIERDIAGARAWLAELVRERQSVQRSARMTLLRNSPEFIAKMQAGYAKAAQDPEWCARNSAIKRARAIKFNAPRKLPAMSKRQHRHYVKCRRLGLGRHPALADALSLEASP